MQQEKELERLEGRVVHVIFENEDTGYTVYTDEKYCYKRLEEFIH